MALHVASHSVPHDADRVARPGTSAGNTRKGASPTARTVPDIALSRPYSNPWRTRPTESRPDSGDCAWQALRNGARDAQDQ